ncbi:MAG TPA: tartrate-resistant acid phosphatase type 5 family protein [Rhodothermales bacterium]|nr:tartrate-resistant acid phosphatase type 5 family protein [Rhodothermales bacterium]
MRRPAPLAALAALLVLASCTGGRPVGDLPEAQPFSSDALNFIVVGDWGRAGFFNQREVAAQMGRTADEIRARFIVSTGDNFYTTGVASVTDSKWRRSFEEIYTAPSLQVPWYVALGNHDWQGDPFAQVAYSNRSTRWELPAPYYSITGRLDDDSTDVLLVFIDTTPLADFERAQIYPLSSLWDQDAQYAWIDSTLAASTAEWKIVIGHHPIVVGSYRYRDNPYLLGQLLPMLERRGVQMYFAGHEHNLQHLRLPGRQIEHFISGAGSLLRTPEADDNTLWALRVPGFMSVSITPQMTYVHAIDDLGRTRYAVNVPLILGPTGPGTPATGEAFTPGEPVPAEGEGPSTETSPATEDDDTHEGDQPSPPPDSSGGGGRRP